MRLCEGPIDPADWLGATGCNEANHGLPRFTTGSFDAAYPLAQVHLHDPESFPSRCVWRHSIPSYPRRRRRRARCRLPVLRYVVTNIGTRSPVR